MGTKKSDTDQYMIPNHIEMNKVRDHQLYAMQEKKVHGDSKGMQELNIIPVRMTLADKLKFINQQKQKYVDDEFIGRLKQAGFEVHTDDAKDCKYTIIGYKRINITVPLPRDGEVHYTQAQVCINLDKAVEDEYQIAKKEEQCIQKFFHKCECGVVTNHQASLVS